MSGEYNWIVKGNLQDCSEPIHASAPPDADPYNPPGPLEPLAEMSRTPLIFEPPANRWHRNERASAATHRRSGRGRSCNVNERASQQGAVLV